MIFARLLIYLAIAAAILIGVERVSLGVALLIAGIFLILAGVDFLLFYVKFRRENDRGGD